MYMFNPKVSTVVPPRIERLSWRLQGYDFEIKHIVGRKNFADSLSRLPLSVTEMKSVADEYIHSVTNICIGGLKAISLKDIELETEKDETEETSYSYQEIGLDQDYQQN